jgi:hypothetical protein
MTKIVDFEERLEAKLKEQDARAASRKITSRRHQILCTAVLAALDAGSSFREIARTLRLIADELERRPRGTSKKPRQ